MVTSVIRQVNLNVHYLHTYTYVIRITKYTDHLPRKTNFSGIIFRLLIWVYFYIGFLHQRHLTTLISSWENDDLVA